MSKRSGIDTHDDKMNQAGMVSCVPTAAPRTRNADYAGAEWDHGVAKWRDTLGKEHPGPINPHVLAGSLRTWRAQRRDHREASSGRDGARRCQYKLLRADHR